MKQWLLGTAVAIALFFCGIANADTLSTALRWNPVTQNTDGTPATITGYRVYRGTTSSTLAAIATVSATTLIYVDTPPPGLYFYAVTALSATAESDKSAVLSNRIHLPAPRGGVVLPAPQGGIVLPNPK